MVRGIFIEIVDKPKGTKGMKQIGFKISTAARRQLKDIANKKDTTQRKLILEGLNLLFKAHGMPPVEDVE